MKYFRLELEIVEPGINVSGHEKGITNAGENE